MIENFQSNLYFPQDLTADESNPLHMCMDKTLTFGALCFKFLCITDLTTEGFQPYMGISKFLTCWVDKTQQEAGS